MHKVGGKVKKVVYARIPLKYRNQHLSAAILNIAAMLVVILKIKLHELGANVENILYAKNPSKYGESNFGQQPFLI